MIIIIIIVKYSMIADDDMEAKEGLRQFSIDSNAYMWEASNGI